MNELKMEVDESDTTAGIVEFSSKCTDENLVKIQLVENVGENLQSDAVCKFINGEITFNDYLNQMEKMTENEGDASEPSTSNLHASSAGISDIDLSDVEIGSSSSGEESDDVSMTKPSKKKRSSQKRGSRSKLSATLRGVMGQANVCYAKGDTETAVKMCLEIIREEPKASEPFKTLASIYEEIGESEKSLQMRLIAAHLGPASKEEWLELAHTLKKNNHLRQAIVCYTKAINLDVMNLKLYEERAALIKESSYWSIEAYGFLRLLYKLDPEKDGQTLLYLCKKVARLYYNDKKYEKSCNTLKYAFEKCPDLITYAEVNLFLDVLITTQNFKECLEVMANFCSVEFKMTHDPRTTIEECTVPEDIPIDIRAKLIIALIHFDSFENAKIQIDVLLKENPEVMGDLFFDVAMELIDKERYEDSIELLEPLTPTETFNSDALWFKLSYCYKQTNKIKQCHETYRRALKCYPNDKELKLKFCEELKSAQMYEEAIKVTLSENISLLIYERCNMYLLLNDVDNFIETGLQLFRLHCKEIKTVEDYRILLNVLHTVKWFKDILSPHVPSTIDTSVSIEDEWNIFLKICNIYIQRRDYDLLQQLTLNLCLSFKFVPFRDKLRFAISIASFLNNDYEIAYDMIRYFKLNNFNSQKSWNYYNLVTFYTDYNRMHKFLIRFLMKHPEDDSALMLFANNCLSAGTYKYALNDYGLLFEKQETPLVALLLAVTVLHISCQKYSTNKHSLVTQMIAFLRKYEDLRGSEMNQEIYYNIGRAFHQVELLPQAMYYYKKALNCDRPLGDLYDLKCDIAYNLHLIYLNSGQTHVANMYLQKYVVI